ncbi:disease resistance protein RPV1-like isoform X2 [Macadamia integrifolia]|uniref:disease resistance protein RPV1-like isoform X2 n=1 Tax=Macadamia integrifolia TaxID=60698 RepID=UPI001C4FAA6F|nr:disease resistance protein RPV1-like isoform X2 [Macadamia integrifolia]
MAFKRTREDSSYLYSTKLQWNYDVFLNFSEDTKENFTHNLYNALVGRGIHTFRNDDDKPWIDEISSEVQKAIDESRIAIVIFSSSYASSRSCLEELVKILECKRRIGQTVFPVFYDVCPSDVRNQTGTFEEEFEKHQEFFKENIQKVSRWREALKTIANLSGWHLQNIANGTDKQESTFIQKIIEEVLTKIKRSEPLHVANYPVGLDSRVGYVKGTLNLSSLDVRIVGICGMGGLGKTTIAKAVYNQINQRFEGHSFLANVGEVSKQPNGLIQLQEQFLSDILMKNNLKISNVARGINMIKQRLSNRKVLVILDDIDQPDQLIGLNINRDWFGMGSRIIITSRNEQLLNRVDVDEIYEVHEFNQSESLELFSWHAFKRDCPISGYMELSKDIVGYVGGLPLALEVLGSLMADRRSIPEWEIALDKLKRIPDHNQIEGKLRLSFDELDDEEKDTFLDIACFFIGMDKDYVIKILDGCGFFPDIGVSVLNRRSLIRIGEDNELKMHNLLRDMGRKIVFEESPGVPGRRSRLWFHEDVCEVLAKHEGTNSVEGLILNISQIEDIYVTNKAFANMHRLRLLQLNNVHLMNLVVLDMQNSHIKKAWNKAKVLGRLKILNLSHSRYLTKSPNFLGIHSLEMLILEGCTSLVEVHDSIGYLDKLVVLNLKNCNNLKNLPSSICKLVSLEVLDLSGCPKQDRSKSWNSLFFHSWVSLRSRPLLPAFSGLSSLSTLNLSHCNLSRDHLPNDFSSLSSLTHLFLSGNSFCTLPTGIGHLSRLMILALDECTNLQLLPELPSSLMTLGLKDCTSLERLPANIGTGPAKLMILLLSGCIKLCALPELPSSLIWLKISGCTSIEEIPKLWKLKSLQGLQLNYDHFCNLPEDISFHTQLRSLFLDGYTKPRSLPKLPSSVNSLVVDGCTSMVLKEVEFQKPKTSQSISAIHMDECHHLETTLRKKSPFQGLYERFEVIGPGSEIPEWMAHQSMGSSISFEVSPHLGCKFQGLDASAVFAIEEEDENRVSSMPIIFNKTTGTKWVWLNGSYYTPRSPYQDQMWVCHIPFSDLYVHLGGEGEFEAQEGDQLEFSINFEIENFEEARVQVKKCGVLQVHKPDEETRLDEDQSMIQYTSDDVVEC